MKSPKPRIVRSHLAELQYWDNEISQEVCCDKRWIEESNEISLVIVILYNHFQPIIFYCLLKIIS